MTKRMMLAVAVSAVGGAFAVSTADYVQDGLVAHYDGIDNMGTGTHDPNATTWKNLVTGNAAVQTGTKTITVGANCYHFKDPRSTLQETLAGFNATVAASGGFTLDYTASYSSLTLGLGLKMGGAGMYFQDGKLTYTVATGQCGGWKAVPANRICTGAVVYDAACTPSVTVPYFDGVRTPPASISWKSPYLPGSEVVIGNLSGNSAVGDIYAVRVYGRRLEAEEVLRNWIVDQIRYKGTYPEGYRDEAGALQQRVRVGCPAAGGTVKVDGTALAADFEEWAAFGTAATHTLEATPAAGYMFTGWTGDADAITSGSIGTRAITVASSLAMAFTPVFTAIPSPALAAPVVTINVDSGTTSLDDWLTANPDVTIGTSGTIVKTGNGTLQVTSDVIGTFAGEIVIEQGRWHAMVRKGLGAMSGGDVWVKDGATLYLYASTTAEVDSSTEQIMRKVYIKGKGTASNGALIAGAKVTGETNYTFPRYVTLLGDATIRAEQHANFCLMYVDLNRFTATLSPVGYDWQRLDGGCWSNGNITVTSYPLLIQTDWNHMNPLGGGAENVIRFEGASGYRANTYAATAGNGQGLWTAVMENNARFYGPNNNGSGAGWNGPVVLEGDTCFDAQNQRTPFVFWGPISGPGNLGKTTSRFQINRIKLANAGNTFTGGIWLKYQSLEATVDGAIPANGAALSADNSSINLSEAMTYHLPDLALSGTGIVYSAAATTGSFKDAAKTGNSLITWNTKVGARSFALGGGTLKFGAQAAGVDFGRFSAAGATLDLSGQSWTCTNLTGAATLVDGTLTVDGPWTLDAAAAGTLGGGTATVAFGPKAELSLANVAGLDKGTVYTIATSAAAFADKVPLSEATQKGTGWRVRLSADGKGQELYYGGGMTLTIR